MKGIQYESFPKLVDHCAAHIMKELIKGNFRNGVYDALVLMGQWQQARIDKQQKEN
jgi:hypothetical protein